MLFTNFGSMDQAFFDHAHERALADLENFLSFYRLEKIIPKKIQIILLALFIVLSIRLWIGPALSSSDTPYFQKIRFEVQSRAKLNDKVIAQFGSSPELLFYFRRLGWPFEIEMTKDSLEGQARHIRLIEKGYGDPKQWLEYLRTQGAQWFVISEPVVFRANKPFYEYVTSKYSQLSKNTDDFLIFDLK